jgi:hypothetical protein
VCLGLHVCVSARVCAWACVPRRSGGTGAQRLRVVVGPAGFVRVEVHTAGDSVPKATKRVVWVYPGAAVHLARDDRGTLARILGDGPDEVCRADAPAGAAERECCTKNTIRTTVCATASHRRCTLVSTSACATCTLAVHTVYDYAAPRPLRGRSHSYGASKEAIPLAGLNVGTSAAAPADAPK